MYKDKFIWDAEKYLSNIGKHGIAFEEASSVFEDEQAIYEYDDAHTESEERFKVIGFSERARLLMVCHCYRNGDNLIRIISARKATKREHTIYGRQKHE